ncbi:MAG: acyl-CoA/acyl-ACP dehydrogenase [bacterium]|nr:acyl-CoA/acyl-ACP dehydrogenase [bacterium]
MASSGAPKNFGFGEDEELLRDLARKFLDEQLPVEKLRALVAADPEAVYERGEPTSWDEGLWKQIVELGWTGLAVPEAAGGAGFKVAGIVGLVEEVGRHALPSPLISTLNATFVLREGEPEAASEWLGRIADGAPATLAITDARGSWAAGDTGVSARQDGDAVVLSGRASFVQDAQKAELLVVTARQEDALLLCIVPADAAGLEFERDHIHDLTRDQASIGFDEVRIPAANVVSREAEAALARAWPSLLVTVAADLCGTSEWQLQATVEYAKHRKQFDRPLGFFQAVKHPLVDVMVGVDRARSILYHAACCIDEGSDDAETAARMAKSAASDAGAYASDRSVQLHGGIGFTWECDVHLFFKRSLHNQLLYGDGTYQRQRLAEELFA